MFSGIKVNHDIPRTMTERGLRYLGFLASQVPENGLIIEVGPLFGSSTWVLSQNAHPSVRIISIDTWEPQPWIDKVEDKFPGCRKFGKDAFDYYVRDCENVEAIQGWSPDVLGDFSDPIDLFFDDATHGDPGFSESIAFYEPLVKPGGIICGDDFAGGWPDIVRRVGELGESYGIKPEITGRVWAFTKPEKKKKPVSIHRKYGPFEEDEVSLSMMRSDGTIIKASPGVWAGDIHSPTQFKGVRLDVKPGCEIKAADGRYRVFGKHDEEHVHSRWVGFGEWAQIKGSLTDFQCRLVGPSAKKYRLTYQLNLWKPTANRFSSRNTRLRTNKMGDEGKYWENLSGIQVLPMRKASAD